MPAPTELRRARTASGKTVDEICDAVGIKRATLYRAEKGVGQITPEHAQALYEFYLEVLGPDFVPFAHVCDPIYAPTADALAAAVIEQ